MAKKIRKAAPGPWEYVTDETPKRKHHWRKPIAGFDPGGPRNFVGKCPSTLSPEDAQRLLDAAIPYASPIWPEAYPERLYAVKDGVLYRAAVTVPGHSYHGFPEHRSRFPGGTAGRALKEELLVRSQNLGCEQELRKWMGW